MRKLRPSDLTDDQWAIVEPLIPVHATGRPRVNDRRGILNAVFHLNRSGCRWDMLPTTCRPRAPSTTTLRGVKRHIVVDTLGLLMGVAASADDGTYAPEVLGRPTPEHRTWLKLIWGDGKYNNRSLDRWTAEAMVSYRVEVIGRPPGSVGFVKLPSRWVVERTVR